MDASLAKEVFSSSSSMPPRWKYDVFLSFRSADTRRNFTSHLLAALERHGFHTFRDDTKLDRGEDIGSELLKAIKESKFSIIMFSKNYVASSWCLDELVKIMECRKTLHQIVLPIFYDVDPSDVRYQKGSLAKAFVQHEERVKEGPDDNKVQKWRSALTEVANLAGWDMQNASNRDEAKFIEEIIEKLEYQLDPGLLSVAGHPVGVEYRVLKLKRLLRMESNDVCIVAVWGIGGIGKTTIAKYLYNLIKHKFEGSIFLENVGETSKQRNGLVDLQEQLLSGIFRNNTHCIRNSHHGTEVIKRRVSSRKVLLVLDDVDDVKQLKTLAIDQDCFHLGSRIIITTRNKSLINLLGVYEIYELEKLTRDESLQLFSWYTFKENHPIEDYVELSEQVVHYTKGLPLALEVLGSFLSRKSIPEWESAIAKLKKIPHDDIQGKLKISFDSLSNEVKELFLDIVCFFVGMDQDFLIKILESCKLYPVIGIRVLTDQGLIKYEGYRIVMHDMLRDMGREIVRKESVKEPGRRSRLWNHEDALEVLRDGTGTESVEGFFLNLHEPKDVQVNAKAFENMNKLRLLNLKNICVRINYEHISKRLLWLSWNGFPWKCMSSKLYMENLVALDLCHSGLKQVWKGTKNLDKLKFLYLSHCYYLTKTPDFSGLKNLEKLLLNDCIRLVEVDESIRYLTKLVVLDMKNCEKLRKLPSSIWTLESLEHLDLSGCPKLGNLAGLRGSPSKSRYPFLSFWTSRTKSVDSIGLSLASLQFSSCLKELSMANCNLSHLSSEIGSLISLRKLVLGGNNLCTIPDSIGNLTCLEYLDMANCNVSSLPSEIGSLISLQELVLYGNNLCTIPNGISNLTRLLSLKMGNNNMSHLTSEIGSLSSLRSLDLCENNFRSLPDSISNLTCLEYLYLDNCARLQSLPKLPMSSLVIYANYCSQLESIAIEANNQSYRFMDLFGCRKLDENSFTNNVIKRFLQDKVLSARRIPFGIVLPSGAEFSNFVKYQSRGTYLSFVVPPLVNQKVLGFLFCGIFIAHKKESLFGGVMDFCFRNKTKGIKTLNAPTSFLYLRDFEDEVRVCSYVPLSYLELHLKDVNEMEISILDPGAEMEISILYSKLRFPLEKWGMNLICKVDDDNENENNNIIIMDPTNMDQLSL